MTISEIPYGKAFGKIWNMKEMKFNLQSTVTFCKNNFLCEKS